MSSSTTTITKQPPGRGGPSQAQQPLVKTIMPLDYEEEPAKPLTKISSKPSASKKTSSTWLDFKTSESRISIKDLEKELEKWKLKQPNEKALVTNKDLWDTFMKEEPKSHGDWALDVVQGGVGLAMAAASGSAPFELMDFAKEQLMDKIKDELQDKAGSVAEDGVKFVANSVRRREFNSEEEFKKSGIQKARKVFVEDVGKNFVGFSIALALGGTAVTGGIGLGFAILFSVIVYLDAVDAAKDKQMRYDIYKSITAKYNRIKENSQMKIQAARKKKAERPIMSSFQQDLQDVEVLGKIELSSGQIRHVLWADVHNMREIAGDFEFPRNEYGAWTRRDLAVLFANHLEEITYIRKKGISSSDPFYKRVQESIKEVSKKMTENYAKSVQIHSERFTTASLPAVVDDLDPIVDEDDLFELDLPTAAPLPVSTAKGGMK